MEEGSFPTLLSFYSFILFFLIRGTSFSKRMKAILALLLVSTGTAQMCPENYNCVGGCFTNKGATVNKPGVCRKGTRKTESKCKRKFDRWCPTKAPTKAPTEPPTEPCEWHDNCSSSCCAQCDGADSGCSCCVSCNAAVAQASCSNGYSVCGEIICD